MRLKATTTTVKMGRAGMLKKLEDKQTRSDSRSQTVYRNDILIPVNRLTPTAQTDPPEPATTIRTFTVKQMTLFAPTGADSRNRSRNLNLPALYAYPQALTQKVDILNKRAEAGTTLIHIPGVTC